MATAVSSSPAPSGAVAPAAGKLVLTQEQKEKMLAQGNVAVDAVSPVLKAVASAAVECTVDTLKNNPKCAHCAAHIEATKLPVVLCTHYAVDQSVGCVKQAMANSKDAYC